MDVNELERCKLNAFMPVLQLAISAGFRTNEALCLLDYEALYLCPEGGRNGRPTHAVRYTCSGS